MHVGEKLDDVVDVLAHALARVGVERRPAGQFVVGAEVLLHAGRHQQSAGVLKTQIGVVMQPAGRTRRAGCIHSTFDQTHALLPPG